jgi:hypothetical protein
MTSVRRRGVLEAGDGVEVPSPREVLRRGLRLIRFRLQTRWMLRVLTAAVRVLIFMKWWFSVLLLLLALTLIALRISFDDIKAKHDTGPPRPLRWACVVTHAAGPLAGPLADYLCDEINNWFTPRHHQQKAVAELQSTGSTASRRLTSAAGQPRHAPVSAGTAAPAAGSRTYRLTSPVLRLHLIHPVDAVLTTLTGRCVWSSKTPSSGKAVLPGAAEVLHLIPARDATVDFLVRNSAGRLGDCLITVVDPAALAPPHIRSGAPDGGQASARVDATHLPAPARPTPSATQPTADSGPASSTPPPADGTTGLLPCLASTGIPTANLLRGCSPTPTNGT